jgi:integrase/recombinase XerD
VQRVLSPNGGGESWTLIGDDRRPVAPVEAYLAWLSRIERAPNTVRAYAQDLKAFWEFLAARELAWDRVTLEQLGLFTAWLRQPADNVVLLAGAEPRRAASTVNRMLSAVMGFYDFHARHGVEVARALVDRSRSGRGSYKPFLEGIAPSRSRARVGRLRESRRPPRTLSLEQVAAVLEAQRRLRDRFLFALLFGTGMRIGQALGLRHCDFVSHERRVEIVGARG